MQKNNTIVALATPPGVAGLSVVRLSGPDSFLIADKCFKGNKLLSQSLSHTIHYGKLYSDSELIDYCTASIFRNPKSYTGEDTIEFGIHGSNLIANRVIESLVKNGAEYAMPGEFTKRAFLNGKLDLNQVEAVADLIHSLTVPGAQTAAKQLSGGFSKKLAEMRLKLLDIAALLELELDFSEEDLELIPRERIKNQIIDAIEFCDGLINSYSASEIMRNGYFVGIAGYPNSGKSTLFNTIIGRNRAIVSSIEGTTRDYLEDKFFVNGFPITIADTAGIRQTDDEIEIEGIRFVETVLNQSNMIIVLNDINNGIDFSSSLYNSIKEKYSNSEVIYLQNKVDNLSNLPINAFNISAINNQGIEQLKLYIYNDAVNSISTISDVLINKRQSNLLNNARNALVLALKGLDNLFENELIAIDIRKAVKILGEITGEIWNEEVLEHIFSRFCIGK